MYFLVQLTKCSFLFVVIFGNILSLPLLPQGRAIVSSSRRALIHRVRRQGPIVQPSWVPNSDVGLFEDYNVRVTDEKLEETEAIRGYIQETVDNGTYVVELDEEDFEEDETQNNENDEEVPAEELSQPGPELKVEPKHMTTPMPKPGPPSSPERKSAPKENQSHAPQPVNKPSIFARKIKIAPKIYSALAGRPFFAWFKKSSVV